MKILLLGEFSALHKNLKEGLQEIGHEVVIASTGDGWKCIESDIDFNSKLPGALGKIARSISPLLKINQLANFDVVQYIFPDVIKPILGLNYRFFEYLNKYNKSIFLLAAGDDAFFWQKGRKKLKYGPFDDYLKYDACAVNSYWESESSMTWNKYLVDRVKGVIPVMYEYEESYRGQKNLKPVIPLPVNISKIEYVPNKILSKMVVFHGLNRYGFKGTRHIEKAFDILRKKYPEDLELIIDGEMPLNDYLKLMQRTNIVIDQTYSHSCGMNAIYALAMGKVVLGGAEPESLKALGVNDTPVINILPDPSDIVKKVECLLEQRNRIEEIGYKSRMFAENVHGHLKIARQYIDTWSTE